MRLIDADELKKCAIPCELHNGALTDLCIPLYQINSAPTVEEKPHGKWLLCEDSDFSKCSICGVIWLNEECNNYCPKCGAYMRSEDNGKK